MNSFIKKFLNYEVISYVVVGILTTLLNIFLYDVFCNKMGMSNLIANAAAWLFCVIFAFAANDIFVFRGKKKEFGLWKRSVRFFLARLTTLALDEAGMYILVDICVVNNMLSKVIMNIFVIVINYGLSKWIIFR